MLIENIDQAPLINTKKVLKNSQIVIQRKRLNSAVRARDNKLIEDESNKIKIPDKKIIKGEQSIINIYLTINNIFSIYYNQTIVIII